MKELKTCLTLSHTVNHNGTYVDEGDNNVICSEFVAKLLGKRPAKISVTLTDVPFPGYHEVVFFFTYGNLFWCFPTDADASLDFNPLVARLARYNNNHLYLIPRREISSKFFQEEKMNNKEVKRTLWVKIEDLTK